MQQNFHTFQLFQFVFFCFLLFVSHPLHLSARYFCFVFAFSFFSSSRIYVIFFVYLPNEKKTIILYFILFFSYSSNCFAVVLFSAVAPCRARGFYFVFIKGQFSFFLAILGPVFCMGVSVDNVCGYLFENKGNTNECVFFFSIMLTMCEWV